MSVDREQTTAASVREPSPSWIPRADDDRPSRAMPTAGFDDWREQAEWWQRTCEYWAHRVNSEPDRGGGVQGEVPSAWFLSMKHRAEEYEDILQQIAGIDPTEWHEADGWKCVRFIQKIVEARLAGYSGISERDEAIWGDSMRWKS